MRKEVLCLVVSLLPTACDKEENNVVVGTLERDRIELIAEAQEPIVEIAVREGDRVEKGRLLLRLDDARVAAQLAGARSAAARSEARLKELVRGPRQERITEARARLVGTESALVSAGQNLERAKRLLADDVGTQERVDNEQARYEESIAKRDEARASLEAMLEGTTVEELDQARAALAEADAVLGDLEIRAERLVVLAPRDGIIDALPYEVGERPRAGAVVVVMLADQAPYARVYVPESLRVRVQSGTIATIHVDGVAQTYKGRVRFVSHDATFTPYYALTEHDRSRLSYVAEVDLIEPEAMDLPTGIPVQLSLPLEGGADSSEGRND